MLSKQSTKKSVVTHSFIHFMNSFNKNLDGYPATGIDWGTRNMAVIKTVQYKLEKGRDSQTWLNYNPNSEWNG